MQDLQERHFDLRTFIKVVLTVGLIGFILVYVAFQARFLITGPEIVLTNEPETYQNVRVVTLEGTAHNITRLWLNDRQIFTDESGKFKEALVLENGYTITNLRARDRYGRETRVVRSFVYTPASIIK